MPTEINQVTYDSVVLKLIVTTMSSFLENSIVLERDTRLWVICLGICLSMLCLLHGCYLHRCKWNPVRIICVLAAVAFFCECAIYMYCALTKECLSPLANAVLYNLLSDALFGGIVQVRSHFVSQFETSPHLRLYF